MQCSSCGSELPAGAAHCPTCGIVTPYNVSAAGVSPYAPTFIESPYDTTDTSEPKPATYYGSSPYGAPLLNPYEQNPYASQPSPDVLLQQPRPSAPKRGVNNGVIIGVVVLLLILSVAGVFATLGLGTKNSPATTTPATNNAVTNTPTTNNAANNPYPPFSGTLALNDPLRDNSRGYSWYEGDPYNNTACQFIGGAYHVSIYQTGLTPCTAGNTNFSNFAFEVQTKMIKGGDSAEGIIFYANNQKYYIFNIFQNGTYGLYLRVNITDTPTMLKSGPSSAIKVGLNQTNLMAVVARNGTFDLYVNQQKLDSVSDTTYSKGQIGVDASTANVPAEVVYSNARAWTL